MGYRRKAREHVLQALFYMDMRQNISEEALALYKQTYPLGKKIRPFFDILVSGVMNNQVTIDSAIQAYSQHWKLHRMGCVDRNLLRMAVFELLFCNDIPPRVTINEAVDLGKKFGTDESGAFINGIIDSIRDAYEKGHLPLTDDAVAASQKV